MDSKKQEVGDRNPWELNLDLAPSIGSAPALDLVLSIGPPLPPPPPPPYVNILPSMGSVPLTLPLPPFPWATDNPGIHHPLSVLVARGIRSVHGVLQCHSCVHRITVAYDLLEKYKEVYVFLLEQGEQMNDRAPAKWMCPEHEVDCSECGGKGSMMPVVAEEAERINWLFLFLGQTLGVCKLVQLKWLGKLQAKFHITGAKNRLVYKSYVAICSQLQPDVGKFQNLLKAANK